MADLKQVTKDYFDSVLNLIPEDQREQARSLYNRAQDQAQEAADALAANQASLQDWHGNLLRWSKQRETELAERETSLNGRERQPSPTRTAEPPIRPTASAAATPVIPENVVTRDQLNEILNGAFDQFGRQIVGVDGETLDLMQQHARLYHDQPDKRFNSVELFAHPLAKTHGLTAAFNEIHKERIEQRRAAVQAEHDEKMRLEGEQRVLAKMGTSKVLPYPAAGEDDSAIGIIERRNADSKEKFGAEAATDFYRQWKSTGVMPS